MGRKNGRLFIVADSVKELSKGVVNADGTVTYTYELRDDLKWSDGKKVKASDFVFSWNRAASPETDADYGYMFEVVDGYAEMYERDSDGSFRNPDAKLNVVAPNDTTLVVTLDNAVAYWNELLAFPAYFPVREDVVANENWATEPSTYICNGPYTIDSWEHNSVIILKKNDNYFNAKRITMEEIKFFFSHDANRMISNYEIGNWQMIDDVPTDEIAILKDKYPKEFVVTGQIGTYYICWNINEDILPVDSSLTGVEAESARAEIRNALGLLIDRNYIVEEIGQVGQIPASSFVAMGMTNPDGSQFYRTAGHNDDFEGYFDVSKDAKESNFAKAIEILKKYYDYDGTKFTNFPTLTYLYDTSETNKEIGVYLQSVLASVGIEMALDSQQWATFLERRKQGDYSVARAGWLADYNDPICFLDMWVTASGNNSVQFGRDGHTDINDYSMDLTDCGYDIVVEKGTWAETYDVLISTIKSCTDADKRYMLMHKAEDMLMSTGCITPLYFYTDIYMIDDSVQGFFSNPLGFKYFMYTTIKKK